uniref:EF-hand domain-containing protein n=1 Tax=Heterorhabditis bacteriophora TaxID=37862 RepID=A0A1I7WWR3_HETBA
MKRHQPARSENPSPEFHPEFVDALRVLFDILDTSRTGRVSYETQNILLLIFFDPLFSCFVLTFSSFFLLSIRIITAFSQSIDRAISRLEKCYPVGRLISFERFLTAVKLSFRERAEINNNTLHRVQSEGKLNQNIDKRRMQAPAMGVNGFDRRSQIYVSQPALNEERKNHQYISQLNVAPIYASLATTNGSSNTNVNNYGDLHYDGLPQVVMRPRKVNTVRSQKEESRMRHPLPPSGVYGAAPRVAVARSRPHSTASYNSLASSGLENIAWRNSSLSTSTADSQRRNTMCEEDSTPRVVSPSMFSNRISFFLFTF